MMDEVRARKRKGVSEEDDLENQNASESKPTIKGARRSLWLMCLQGIAVILLIFILYLAIVPSPIDPQPVSHHDPLPRFSGVLAPNTKLQEAVKIVEGKVSGPESITQDKKGNIYTGLGDGRIIKITPLGKIQEITRTGDNLPSCGSVRFEPECGRPLGLRFDLSEQNLIVCDAYLGLLQVNPDTGELKTLISSKDGMDGVPFKFLNDLAIAADGTIYFTDSSWKWERRENRYALMEGGGQGRLMSYNPETGLKQVLLNGLYFPNGVELSPEEDFVLFCETTMSRVTRYYINGTKKGVYDLFAENLPGYPDNIRPSKNGGYWVGMAAIRKWPFSVVDFLWPYPNIRKIITKLISQDTIMKLAPKYGLLIKLDDYGDIIKSYHDPSGTIISEVSEVHENTEEGVLYLGSYQAKYLAKIKL